MDEFTLPQRLEVIHRYANLRVADVCDALDAIGLLDRCSMGPEIRPVWRD